MSEEKIEAICMLTVFTLAAITISYFWIADKLAKRNK